MSSTIQAVMSTIHAVPGIPAPPGTDDDLESQLRGVRRRGMRTKKGTSVKSARNGSQPPRSAEDQRIHGIRKACRDFELNFGGAPLICDDQTGNFEFLAAYAIENGLTMALVQMFMDNPDVVRIAK